MVPAFSIDPMVVSALFALGLGAVIGLEREIMIQRKELNGFGGVRTFAFIGLLGAIAGILGNVGHIALTVLAFGTISLFMAISYNADRIKRKDKLGLTSEITAIITFTIGLLAAYEQLHLGLIITISVLAVLALRENLHTFARRLENQEVFAAIKFAVIAFIILPFLPNETFDAWDALNPHKIWLIVVLISGLNFAGYILNKALGSKRGMALTGLFGGLVSSTAVSLSLAEQSKDHKLPTHSLVTSLLLAQAASLILTAIQLFILNRTLFLKAIPALGGAIILLCAFAAYHYKKCEQKGVRLKKAVKLKSPFTLSEALIFGGIFSVIMLLIKILFSYIGNAGIYITGIFSGLISLDALTVSMAEIAGDSVTMEVSLKVLIIGITMSIIQKIIALFLLGDTSFRKKAAPSLTAVSLLLLGFVLFTYL